jgi:hypothetical protein
MLLLVDEGGGRLAENAGGPRPREEVDAPTIARPRESPGSISATLSAPATE